MATTRRRPRLDPDFAGFGCLQPNRRPVSAAASFLAHHTYVATHQVGEFRLRSGSQFRGGHSMLINTFLSHSSCGLPPLEPHSKPERTALADSALDADVATHELNQFLADG